MEREYNCNTFFVKDVSFYRHLIVLAVPIILQNLITFGVVLADNLMIGRFGDAAISGLYMGTLVHTLIQTLIAGIESTALILCAQYWGKNDLDRIKDVISISMRLSIGLTLFFTCAATLFPDCIMRLLTHEQAVVHEGAKYLRIAGFSYLFFCVSQILVVAMRSVEIVRIGLINAVVACISNVLLNMLFIFGMCGFPRMAVAGAALATLISRILELCVVLYFVMKVDKRLLLKFHDFLRWNKDIFNDIIRYGTPILLGQLVWAFNHLMQRTVLGHLNAGAITAASVTGVLDNLIMMGVWGLASATGIVVGKTIGAGEYERVKQYARTMQVIFALDGVLSMLIVYFVYPLFLSCYNLSADAYQYTCQFMLVLSVAVFGRCYQAPSLFGLVKSGGDTAFVFKNDTFWVIFWILPLSVIALYFHFEPWIVFAILLSDQITKCFVAVVKINSFNWIHNLTR